MKVRFNGLLSRKSKGCGACGKRASGTTSLVTSKMYFLPSGASKTFVIGNVEEVSDEDGRFLLSYITEDENGQRSVFEEVV